MPRYELIDGASKKFWQIERGGGAFTTTYGRIGTEGQVHTKSFATKAEAEREYDKLVAEKTRKGYRLVGGAATAPPKPKAKHPAPERAGSAGKADSKRKTNAAPKPIPLKDFTRRALECFEQRAKQLGLERCVVVDKDLKAVLEVDGRRYLTLKAFSETRPVEVVADGADFRFLPCQHSYEKLKAQAKSARGGGR